MAAAAQIIPAIVVTADAGKCADDYDPYSQRKLNKPTSDFGALAHFLKANIGVGMLAMPLAFKNGGLTFSFFTTLVIGLICTHCVHMLVENSYILCKHVQVPTLDFADTASEAMLLGPSFLHKFSKSARIFVKSSLVLSYILSISVYIIIISQSVKKIIAEDAETGYWKEIDDRIYILMVYIPILIICTIKNLKNLVPFSIVANVCMLLVLGITFYYMLEVVHNPSERNQMGSIGKLPSFFSTVVFAMEGIGIVIPLENTMGKPQNFLGGLGVLNVGMAIIVVLYTLLGFFGYLCFGDAVEGLITLNLDKNLWAANICQYMICIAIFFTYALQFHVPTVITWEWVKTFSPESKHSQHHYLLRFILVTLTVCLAIAVPNLESIIGLVGATCFSTLGLTLPAVIDTATKYHFGYGKYNWTLWKNILIIILSVLCLVMGTYTSVIDIIDVYKTI